MWPLGAPPLACPDCRGPLEGRSGGALACSGACRRAFPVQAGVPRLLPAREAAGAERRTLRAFERQWRAYGHLRRIFGKDPAAMARNLVAPRMGARIEAPWYRERLVLDAGCGHGRYLGAFASLGARVVGLDARVTPALAAVARGDPRIAVVQGSVLALPFPDRTFDLVFCDGVVHHTPDPRGAFEELARVVRPGGALYVWVYPREAPLREAVMGTTRQVTTRLPGPLVRGLSFALAPLTMGVRSYSGTHLGRATWEECAQVVHDWIAPPLQSHHDYAELAGWAAAAGLRELERLPVPTGILAWRPAACA